MFVPNMFAYAGRHIQIHGAFPEIRCFIGNAQPDIPVFRQRHRNAYRAPAAFLSGQKRDRLVVIFARRCTLPLRIGLIQFTFAPAVLSSVVMTSSLSTTVSPGFRTCHRYVRRFAAEPRAAARIVVRNIQRSVHHRLVLDGHVARTQFRFLTSCRKPYIPVFRQLHRQAHLAPAVRRCGRKHYARSIICTHRGIHPLRRFLVQFDHGTRRAVLRRLYLHRKHDRIARFCAFHRYFRRFAAEPGSAVRIVMYRIFGGVTMLL